MKFSLLTQTKEQGEKLGFAFGALALVISFAMCVSVFFGNRRQVTTLHDIAVSNQQALSVTEESLRERLKDLAHSRSELAGAREALVELERQNSALRSELVDLRRQAGR